MRRPAPQTILLCATVMLALMVAVASGRTWIAGWNDASRLAAVESLVDRSTIAIDDSIFLKDTMDKIYVGGRYYSDKPPVPAFFMAGFALLARWVVGIDPNEDTGNFIYLMTLISSGLAYVIAVCCVLSLALARGLRMPWAIAVTISFGIGSLAVVYSRHVNSHIVVLAAAAGIAVTIARLHHRLLDGRVLTTSSAAIMGLLASIAYVFDLAAGTLLTATMGAYVLYRFRTSLLPILMYTSAALPLISAHHVMNYVLAGTFGPANSVPEYFQYPGSVFDSSNLTGFWNHESLSAFLRYSIELLAGSRGIVTYTPLMVLAALGPALILRTKRKVPVWISPGSVAGPEITFLTAWAILTWLSYATLSTNFSGWAASIRWFIPFLVPMYFMVVELLRICPASRLDFVILSVGQGVLALMSWQIGPLQLPPAEWAVAISAGTLTLWMVVRLSVRVLHATRKSGLF